MIRKMSGKCCGEVAEHLRYHLRTGIVESVEPPRGMRDENALREV